MAKTKPTPKPAPAPFPPKGTKAPKKGKGC
jgi:hypothetical protein